MYVCVFSLYVSRTFVTSLLNTPLTLLGGVPFEQDIFKGWGQKVKRDQDSVEVKAIQRAGVQGEKCLRSG